MDVGEDEEDEERLEQDEELKDSPEGRRKQSGICDGHFEEEGVEEAVSDVDEWVLVDVGVSDAVGSHVVVVVVVERDVVVVGLILRHDLCLWMILLKLHKLSADSRSAWRLEGDLRAKGKTLISSQVMKVSTESDSQRAES